VIAQVLMALVLCPVYAAPQDQPSPNILRNSAFTACANPGVPDWWGTGAPERIEHWEGCYGTEEDSPVPGTRSLRLTSGPKGQCFSVQSHAYGTPPGREYTFSIYLKSREPGLVAALSIGDRSTRVTVGTEWQRHVFTATPQKGHWARGRLVVRFGLVKPGTLWVAAPQLELGDHATPYRPADADRPAAPGEPAPTGPAIPADAPPVAQATCRKVRRGPELDGRAADACYEQAERLGGFTDITTGRPAEDQTECRVVRDQRALYIAFRCLQTRAGKVPAKVTRRDGAVFGEDSVEVFLQPNPADGRYIHLAVNAIGTQFDELGFDTTWDAQWRVATYREESEWGAELKIPFASLPIGSEAPDEWRVNLCRTAVRDGARVHSAWSRVYGGFHQPARFGKLAGMSRSDLAIYAYELADLALAAEGTNKLVLRGRIVSWPALARSARLTVTVRPARGKSLRSERTVELGDLAKSPTVPFSVTIPADADTLQAGPFRVSVRVYNARSRIAAHRVARTFVLTRAAPQEGPLWAVFERSYYTNEPTARLLVRWQGAPRTAVHVTARRAEGEPIALSLSPAGGPLAPGDNLLACDIKSLPTGEYRVTVSAGSGHGPAECEVLYGLTKLAPAKTEVKMSRFNRGLLVNGEPFLAYAQGIHGANTGWWLDDIAEHGFNAVVASFPMYRSDEELQKDAERVRGFLDECLRHSLRVVFWLHPGKGAYPPMREAAVRTITAFRDHPAILCWYLVDEPEGWWEQSEGGKQEADLVDLYRAAKAADPYRPSQINWYSWRPGRGGYGTLDATDLGSLDRYPIARTANPMKSIADIVSLMNTDCRHRAQPTAFWCQMYGYDDAVREPTPAEERCMTYLCLIRGMRLVYYFIYKPMSPDLWASMKPLGDEIATLEPLLGHPDARELAVGTTADTVHYSLWRTGDDELLLMAANAGYERVEGTFDLSAEVGLGRKAAAVLFEDRSIKLRGGKLTDSFEPCARHVYRLK